MKITKIENKTTRTPVTVYNIATEKNNNYFANGVLVHNCFAYFFKSNNPAMKQGDGLTNLRAVNVKQILATMRGESDSERGRIWYDCFYKRRFLLHWGGMADPFCQFERDNADGFKMIEGLAEMAYPTLFSFKGSVIFDSAYMGLFKEAAHQRNFAFQASVITADEDLARLVEIGVPSPRKRIEALAKLHDLGYWTILRLRPYIIGITDKSIDKLLRMALDAGIDGVSMEFFAVDGRCNVGMKERYKWLAQLIGTEDLHKYFARLSPSERGGYMRLNRHVKESHVRRVYEFCAEHGLVCGISDPDFKELNTSGSCCAMPDKYPANPEMCNWSKHQMTYHLKEARKRYHMTGECTEFRFSEVYGTTEDTPYMDEWRLAQDHPTVVGHCIAERRRMTQRIILRQQWNNVKSPANPRNYFHGKVVPIGLDDDGNLVFKYNPMEYESRWTKEGVDLTR